MRIDTKRISKSGGEAEMQTFRKLKCVICDHIYDEKEGDPASGLAPGTKWEDVPETWTCPDCGATKDAFVVVD